MNETDFNGKKLSYMSFGHIQLTVCKLKEILKEYHDDALIYMEASNAYNRANTMWSDKLIDTYPVKDKNHDNEKALMIVGTIR